MWIPGGGSIETWAWCVEQEYLYAYLSYSGFKRGKTVMDGYWAKADKLGVERTRISGGFLQLVARGGNARARSRKVRAARRSTSTTRCCTCTPASPMRRATAPSTRSRPDCSVRPDGSAMAAELTFKDSATPATSSRARHPGDRAARAGDQGSARGHLMILNQFGSVPHDIAMQNIKMTATRGGAEAAAPLGGPVAGQMVDPADCSPQAPAPIISSPAPRGPTGTPGKWPRSASRRTLSGRSRPRGNQLGRRS